MADDSKTPKTCKATVKDVTGLASPCGARISKGQPECRNKKEHVSNHPTGYCVVGLHEGSHTLSRTGKPMKVCSAWHSCSCECHKVYDKMFSIAGMVRQVIDNSEYESPISSYKMPTLEERAVMNASSKAKSSGGPIVIESPLPDVVPTMLRHVYEPTPTGRAARGELESWVRATCDEFLVEKYPEPCTPAFISEHVCKDQGVNAPSVGAVDAVLKRWIELGFAVIEKKPTRFVAYTPEGIKMGLDAMKLRAKQEQRNKVSAAERGLRTVAR